MSREYTQIELERMVQGEQPNPNAVFFEKAQLDVNASKAAGKRIYNKRVYIKLTQPGVTDFISCTATPEHIKEYPLEYQYFEKNRQGVKAPSIDIIPGLDIIHMQELIDMGLPTIPALAAAEMVPVHLQYAHKMAKTLNAALQERDDGRLEKESQQEIEKHGTGIQAQEVLAPNRRRDTTDVRQPSVSRSEGNHGGEAGEGREASGRDDNRQRVASDILSANWNLSIG